MSPQIVIDRRFTGFSDTAHGGYVCGLVAREIGDTALVDLRAPPPVGRALLLRPGPDGVDLTDGEILIAQGRAGYVAMDIPSPVTPAEAAAGMARFPGHQAHLFPCFVCGPHREEGDGLRIFTGPVPGREAVAALWTPHPALADATGHLPAEFVWAALDCPSAWALIALSDAGSNEQVVTAQIAAHLTRPVAPGRPYVVMGWRIGREGRRWFAGTAIFSAEGQLHAAARATWVSVAGWGVPIGLRRWLTAPPAPG